MSDDNVVNFKKDGTRELLVKMLAWHDAGRVQDVVMIGFGTDEASGQQIIAPIMSDKLTLSEVAIANTLMNSYAQGAISYVLAEGTRVDG